MRNWVPSDVECCRAAGISIFGIPCYVRNKTFIEALLSDIGSVTNIDFLTCKLERLDVLSLMIFIKCLDTIRSNISVFLDGGWINVLIVEEVMVRMEESYFSSAEGCSSSNLEDFSSSSETDNNKENLLGKDCICN